MPELFSIWPTGIFPQLQRSPDSAAEFIVVEFIVVEFVVL
jgi:hypothetical protein